MNNEIEFFPLDPHPFRTETIIKENWFLLRKINGWIDLLWFFTGDWSFLIPYKCLMILTRPLISLRIVNNTGHLAQEHHPSLLFLVLLTQSQTLITWMICHHSALRNIYGKMSRDTLIAPYVQNNGSKDLMKMFD